MKVILLPKQMATDAQLQDACFHLQRLGINAFIGHSGPNGSIEISDARITDQEIVQAERFLSRPELSPFEQAVNKNLNR